MSIESTASVPIGEEMLSKLRKTILHKYPVTAEEFGANYQNLFKEIIKPQEFSCQDMGLFAYKIQLEHGILETSFKDGVGVIIKPSKVSYECSGLVLFRRGIVF